MRKIPRRVQQLFIAGTLLAGFMGANAALAADKVPGVSSTEIRVGTLGPQTGPAAAYDGVRKGIITYFRYINDQGGVDGRKLKLFAYDDQYQPSKTVQLAKRLVEQDDVFAMLGNIGSPTTGAIKKYIEKKGVPIIMLCSAADEFFSPPIPEIMGSCIASYTLEGKVMVDYAVKKLGAKRIAFAYSNDDYGTPINKEATKWIKNYKNAELVATVNFQMADSDLSSQAQKLRQAKPDAILVFSQPAPAAHLKKALYQIGINSGNTKYLTTQEGGNDQTLFDLAGKAVWDGSYSIAEMPTPDSAADDPAMQLFLKEFKKDFPDTPPTGAPQLGWASGQVFVAALKKTKDLTRENFLNTFYSFQNWKGSLYSGLTFTKENQHGVTTFVITQAKDGKIVPISGLISSDGHGGFTEQAAK